MKKVINKRAQESMSMPFGIIFSIFLIVVFIVTAFIAVKYFLGISDTTKIGLFYQDFQSAVDDAVTSQSTNTTFKINLPSEIKKVCFANLTSEITSPDNYDEIRDYYTYQANTFLLPSSSAGGLSSKQINHLNITKITSAKNPYRILASGEIKIIKNFYDRDVVVK